MSSIGFDIGKSQGYDETLTNASITAAGNVTMTSGRDVALVGGNIVGKTVDLDVGRDLTILSPQAEGWRDGFSFGLTVGWNPTEFGIRGSKEDGEKAWSSGSSIVATQGIDITVGEDTTLVGALLQATDGDIRLDTGTLTVADLKDSDQYTNVGGSIGLSGGKLGSVGFSYENKDKQGETRTTLDASGTLDVTVHDADKDGVKDTAADKAAAERLLASVNKDAANWQEITKDDYTKLSGDLDVKELMEFGENLQKIQNYQRAQNAAIPDGIASQGPDAVDLYRDAMVRGLSGAELEEYVTSEAFSAQVANRTVYRQLEEQGADPEIVAMALFLTTRGSRYGLIKAPKLSRPTSATVGRKVFLLPAVQIYRRLLSTREIIRRPLPRKSIKSSMMLLPMYWLATNRPSMVIRWQLARAGSFRRVWRRPMLVQSLGVRSRGILPISTISIPTCHRSIISPVSMRTVAWRAPCWKRSAQRIR